MTKEQKEIRRLKNKCWRILSKLIRKQTDNKCQLCGSTKYLNVHHLEDARLNPELFFEKMNLVVLCARCHKFGKNSFHRSFSTAYLYMQKNYPKIAADLMVLKHTSKFIFTKEYLENILETIKEK